MTSRRLGLTTLAAVALFALAVLFSRRTTANPLLDPEVERTYEVAIGLVGDEPRPAPEPRTPPPWIEISAAQITAPLPPDTETVRLPLLADVPAAARSDAAVYLTFDDGPNPKYTNQILDLLDQYDAKATFFVLGRSVDRHPEVVQRIVAEGHAIGNHTYNHEALTLESDEDIVDTLTATSDAIAGATGQTPSCMRPPYGSLDVRTLQLIHDQGFDVAMWEVDGDDWKLDDAYDIAAGVLRQTNLGDRVLLHDGPSHREATVDAVESVLAVLSQRGVTFAALPC